MLFAKVFGIISFIVAGLFAGFYLTGTVTNEITLSFGFMFSVLLGVYMLGVFPAMLSVKVSEARAKR